MGWKTRHLLAVEFPLGSEDGMEASKICWCQSGRMERMKRRFMLLVKAMVITPGRDSC